jgi:hypothetical protein
MQLFHRGAPARPPRGGLLLLAAAMFVGWAAHRDCPEATRLADVFRCH